MFFTLTNLETIYGKSYIQATKWAATKRILLCNMGANEIALNNYLLKEYKKSLQDCCLQLISQSTILRISKKDYRVTFLTTPEDDLASLITFGNAGLQGSDILRYAFKDILKQKGDKS